MTTFALQRDRRTAGPDDFPEQLAELLAHYEGGFPENHPFARLAHSLPGAPSVDPFEQLRFDANVDVRCFSLHAGQCGALSGVPA